MEQGAHHVMIVTRENRDTSSGLPIPDPDGLIVGSRQDPGIFMVEHRGTYVVQMSQEMEQTAFELVVPHLDLVIVAAGDE